MGQFQMITSRLAEKHSGRLPKWLVWLLAGFPLLAGPLSFEPLLRSSAFLSRGPGYNFELRPREAILKLGNATVRLGFVHANPAATLAPKDPLVTRVNYLFGNNPAEWRRNVPTFARLQVAGLYPGVDLVYDGNRRQLEYDLVLAPGADPSPLLLDFDGISSLRLASDGALLLATSAGELRWQRPIANQVIGGKRRPVDCAYRVRMRHQVGFEIGSYDRSLPLTIDPTFEYSTALPDVQVHALQVDGLGRLTSPVTPRTA